MRPCSLAQVNNCQSFIRHGSGACVNESMSVLTDPAAYGILNSELKNCPHTAAVLGRELAAQWQQLMGTLQRTEHEAVSSKNMANAIENLSRTLSDAAGSRLRLKDGTTIPEEVVGQHATRRTCTRDCCMAGVRRSEA